MTRAAAEVTREYGPFPGVDRVNGVTFDGKQIWFAAGDKLSALDPASGKSNRFVTGVSWIDGELWHGNWEGDESGLTRIDPATGKMLDTVDMPTGLGVSGLESDGGDQFFCGGGSSGKVRAVRRPKRRSR
jgi:glutamine cyclotransferase